MKLIAEIGTFFRLGTDFNWKNFDKMTLGLLINDDNKVDYDN